MFKPIFLIAIILTMSAACTATLLLPTDNDLQYLAAGNDSAGLVKMQQGYKLYVNKCSSCHYLYRPITFDKIKWKAEIYEMAEKAKMNEEETILVLNYILAMREVELAKAAATQGTN